MSVELSGQRVDLKAVTDNSAAAGSGVPEAERLLAFADAVVGTDDAALEAARDDLVKACGPEVLVDAAGVVANFQRMVRIADSTGIPLDSGMAAFTTGIREELGLNEFSSASNTPREAGWRQTAAQLLGEVVRGLIKVVGFVRRVTGRAG